MGEEQPCLFGKIQPASEKYKVISSSISSRNNAKITLYLDVLEDPFYPGPIHILIMMKKFAPLLALAIANSMAAALPKEDPSLANLLIFSRDERNVLESRQACSGPISSSPSQYWLELQDHTGSPRGYAPFINERATYPVYRNVRSYNVVGDGIADDTDNLQKAINAISADPNSAGTRYNNEVTTRPALVYIPGGTYRLTKTLDLRLNTILVGDPLHRPVFKASANFNGDSLINGNDFATNGASGTTNFLIAIKNIVIDTTAINKDTAIIALRWGIAQACQLTNIKINMPTSSGGHIGIDLNQGSTITVSDVVST